MKIITYFNTAFVLLLLSTQTGQLSAQVVQAKFGLNDKNGNVILEQEYDEVSQPHKYWPVYIYRKGDKMGLYNFYDSTLYPCVYDEIRYDKRGYVIRQGNKYGFFVGDWMCFEKDCGASVITPQFDEVVFDDDFISVKKDGFYGLYSRGMNPCVLVPFIAENHIHSDYSTGYYYQEGQTHVHLRYDETNKLWNKVAIPDNTITYFPLLVATNEITQAITIYHCKTLKQLSYFPPPASGITQQFNWSGMFVETSEKIIENTRFTWYNPYTGNAFFTRDIEEGDDLQCISMEQYGMPTMGYLITIEKQKRRGQKFVDLGLVQNYSFLALKEPRVRRIHPPLISIGGGSGDGWRWLWMGGR